MVAPLAVKERVIQEYVLKLMARVDVDEREAYWKSEQQTAERAKLAGALSVTQGVDGGRMVRSFA